MKRLTKRTALRECAKLWELIYKTQKKRGFKATGGIVLVKVNCSKKLGIYHYENWCPCCQYCNELTRDRERKMEKTFCDYCPLIRLWPNHCMENDSAYNLWFDGDVEQALVIANAARRELGLKPLAKIE